MIIATVLRSGGEFTPDHVRWLHSQLPKRLSAVCFSDVPITGIETIPLLERWPAYWAKMELFRPEINEDIFYLDLSTVITGDITDILSNERLTMMRDFMFPHSLGSGLMRIPQECKARVYDAFAAHPGYHMARCATPQIRGDQGFLGKMLTGVSRWQNLYPGQILSYRANVVHRSRSKWAEYGLSRGNGSLPNDARIVCFHGHPRPWDVERFESWIPPFNASRKLA